MAVVSPCFLQQKRFDDTPWRKQKHQDELDWYALLNIVHGEEEDGVVLQKSETMVEIADELKPTATEQPVVSDVTALQIIVSPPDEKIEDSETDELKPTATACGEVQTEQPVVSDVTALQFIVSSDGPGEKIEDSKTTKAQPQTIACESHSETPVGGEMPELLASFPELDEDEEVPVFTPRIAMTLLPPLGESDDDDMVPVHLVQRIKTSSITPWDRRVTKRARMSNSLLPPLPPLQQLCALS